jgi:hypothetical protein
MSRQLPAKMRLYCQADKFNRLFFKGKRIKYDSSWEFKTEDYKVKVNIAKAYEKKRDILKHQWISLQVKFTGVIPEISKIIREGDTEKTPSGEPSAILKTIISDKPSDVLTLNDNRFITVSHPFQRDIIVKLEVRCIKKEGVYYFKNYPLRIGNPIVFSPELYNIRGVIIDIEVKKE